MRLVRWGAFSDLIGRLDGVSNSVVWFRRDLRVGDLPTLSAASDGGGQTLGLFVLDDKLLGPAGSPRQDQLFANLTALDHQLDGNLMVVRGDPADVVPAWRNPLAPKKFTSVLITGLTADGETRRWPRRWS
ncbi:hypothetical protein GCM10020255_102060 [Rhodococcus baikonurensis]